MCAAISVSCDFSNYRKETVWTQESGLCKIGVKGDK